MRKFLGIDPGWSDGRKSTALCRLEFVPGRLDMEFMRVGTRENDRIEALDLMARDGITGVGIDGPITRGFELVNRVRPAESILMRGKFQHRGKPAATNGGSGPRLHREATWWGRQASPFVTTSGPDWGPSTQLVIEAFPSSFLSVLHPDKNFPVGGRPWSSTLSRNAHVRDSLDRLVDSVWQVGGLDWEILDKKNADEFDSFICALSVALVKNDQYVAVGDDELGYIVLPPMGSFGAGTDDAAWAFQEIEKNLSSVNSDRRYRELSVRVVQGP